MFLVTEYAALNYQNTHTHFLKTMINTYANWDLKKAISLESSSLQTVTLQPSRSLIHQSM